MKRIASCMAVIPLLCLAQVISHSAPKPVDPVGGVVQPIAPQTGNRAAFLIGRLPALPSGTAPVAAISSAPPTGMSLQDAAASSPSVPSVQPGETPYSWTPYSAVYDRSVPGTALRYVTQDELARRALFFPAFPQSLVQSDLASGEAILDCVMPEKPKEAAKLAMVPTAHVRAGEAAANREGDAK